MKKSLMTLGVLALFVLMAYGQEKKFALYSVAFYNMENLFDTIHDEGKNDYEYLPNGTNQWNTMKYKAKLKNMSEILQSIGGHTETTCFSGQRVPRCSLRRSRPTWCGLCFLL